MGVSRRRSVDDGRTRAGTGGHHRRATGAPGNCRRGARSRLGRARPRPRARGARDASGHPRDVGDGRYAAREGGPSLGGRSSLRRDASRALPCPHRALSVRVARGRPAARSGPPRARRRSSRHAAPALVPRGRGHVGGRRLDRHGPDAAGTRGADLAGHGRRPHAVCLGLSGRLGACVPAGRDPGERPARAPGPGRHWRHRQPCRRGGAFRAGVRRDDGRHPRPGRRACVAHVPVVHAPARLVGGRHRALAGDARAGRRGLRRAPCAPCPAARPMGRRRAGRPATARRRGRVRRPIPRWRRWSPSPSTTAGSLRP